MTPRTYRWLDRICRPIQWIVGFATGLGSYVLCTIAVGNAWRLGPILPILVVTLFGLATTIIHELGHYAAARWAGMTVMHVRFGSIEVIPQQQGWRVRWNAQQKIRVGGFVVAACDPRRPMRPQALCLVAGGPLANLVAVAIFVVLANVWPSAVAGPLLWTCATLNAGVALGNLLPTSRGKGTDGMRLLTWAPKDVESDPRLVYLRLQALSMAGVTADRLPGDQIAALESMAIPMPLIALWYRLKAHQNRGEWQSAAQLRETYESLMQALPDTARPKMVAANAVLRTELAFAEAMQSGDASGLTDGLLPKATAWLVPSLWPRCLALRAILAGNIVEAERLLDETKRYAEQSMDKALPKSEALIRAYMLSLPVDGIPLLRDVACNEAV